MLGGGTEQEYQLSTLDDPYIHRLSTLFRFLTCPSCRIWNHLSASCLKNVPLISDPSSSSRSTEKRVPEPRALFHSRMSPFLVILSSQRKATTAPPELTTLWSSHNKSDVPPCESPMRVHGSTRMSLFVITKLHKPTPTTSRTKKMPPFTQVIASRKFSRETTSTRLLKVGQHGSTPGS